MKKGRNPPCSCSHIYDTGWSDKKRNVLAILRTVLPPSSMMVYRNKLSHACPITRSQLPDYSRTRDPARGHANTRRRLNINELGKVGASISQRFSPYCFAHLAAGNQSSLAVRSLILPKTGTGFGPGGKDAVEALGFRNQIKRATRKLARPARIGAEPDINIVRECACLVDERQGDRER